MNWSPTPTPRAHAFAKRPISSCIATRIERRRPPGSSRASFFASGHPLVEGLFAHYDESSLGRVARFAIEIGRERGEGLVAIYKDGPVFEIVAFDSAGQTRRDWAAAIRQRPLRVRPVTEEANDRLDWPSLIRRLGKRLDTARRPHALAAIAVRAGR